MEIKTANTVIDGEDVRGCITVDAPGVVIRRSRISCRQAEVISSPDGRYTGTGLLIEDSEIDCAGTNGTAIGDTNFTARRLDISGCENGFDVDQNATIEDNYIHELFNSVESHTGGRGAGGHGGGHAPEDDERGTWLTEDDDVWAAATTRHRRSWLETTCGAGLATR
jgi:hypothetical protein